MISLTGDMGRPAEWASKIKATKHVPEQVAAAVAPIFLDLLQQSAAAEQSPSGQPWQADKPATFKRGTSALMRRSGATLGAITVAPVGRRITARAGGDGYRYQRGKRDLLPTELPEQLGAAIDAETKKAFADTLR